MDIEQARTFLAITAHGSFLEAARQLHLTQSTVSARIHRLEGELGTRLFVRNRSGASLTPSGRRFLEYANARVVEPLPRARARALVARACDLAREINAGWSRNPLEVAALAPFGVYLSREPHLDELPLGVVLRMRPTSRRARFRMQPKADGVREVRAAFEALSSFARIRLATAIEQLPQPCAIVFQTEADAAG